MTTRRDFINQLATGLLGGAAALALVGTGRLLAGDIACDTTSKGEKALLDTINEFTRSLAIQAVGTPEHGYHMTHLSQWVGHIWEKRGKDYLDFGYGMITGPDNGVDENGRVISIVDGIYWRVNGDETKRVMKLLPYNEVYDRRWWAQGRLTNKWYLKGTPAHLVPA